MHKEKVYVEPDRPIHRENKFTLLIPILFATVLLLLDTFSNRNRLSIVGLILFALALAGFIVIIIKDIKILKIDLALFVAAVALLSFFYNSGTYAKASYRYNKIASLIIALPSNVESQIYMYLDTRSRLLIYTRQFTRSLLILTWTKRTGTNTLAT